MELRFKTFKDVLKSREDVYNVDFRHFNKKVVKLESVITHWNSWKLDKRKTFLETFAVEKWKKLPFHKKRKRTLISCKGCQQIYGSVQSTYPVKSNIFKKMQNANPLPSANQVASDYSKSKGVLSKSMINDAKVLYDKINQPFKKLHNDEFSEALTKYKGVNLQLKRQKNESKKKIRKNYQSMKSKLESRWKENDADAFLQTRISYSKWQNQRLISSFETKEQAKQ